MSNGLRLTGLATGMDTDTMIKQLMKPYNMKVDKVKQQRQSVQWKQDMMRDMIKDLRGLKNTYLNTDSPEATNMINSKTFSIGSIASTNEGLLTATALPGTTNAPANVKIKQVAEPAKLSVPLKQDITAATTMNAAGFETGATFDLKIGTETFSLDVKQDETIQQFINRFNSLKGATSTVYEKAKLSFSELTGSLNIETRDTGSTQAITLDFNAKPGEAKQSKTDNGADALVQISPRTDYITRSTNEFAIDNVRYNINPNAVVDSSNPSTVNLTLKPDAQKAVDKIKGFVDKYNEIVDKMYAKYSERKDYKFNPLTDDQKKDMKEDEIKKWETKAKTGLLKNDDAIGSMLSEMRKAIFGPVEGSGISLREIGLDGYSGIDAISKPGQIKIDTNKLKAALETRGDQVMNLFAQKPDPSIENDVTLSKEAKQKKIFDNTGAFKRLDDVLNNYAVKFDGVLLKKSGLEGTLSATKNDFTDKLKEQDTLISKLERKLATQEEMYYQKFAKLEKAMNQMNAQSSSFLSQFGGGK